MYINGQIEGKDTDTYIGEWDIYVQTNLIVIY
jgi:hypothetical protein